MGSEISAFMLYDLVQCPHRVTMDLFTDSAERDQVSSFVQLLWERGALYEKEVVSGLAEPFIDLSSCSGEEKEERTLDGMARGEPLIYSGRIQAGDLLGEPDLLRREGDVYVAGDIKSGAGEESFGEREDGKPKKHYAVQLALYTDVLEQLGRSAARRAFVWDIHGDEVPYDFATRYGKRNPRTLWEDYKDALSQARAIAAGQSETIPAHASACKLCVWYSSCLRRLTEADDLTLIPELGRSKRDAMMDRVATVGELAASDPAPLIAGKKTVFPGVGAARLEKFHRRAQLLSSGGEPFLREPIGLPLAEREIFFDVEVDPMRDVCYLHGFLERRGGDSNRERFISFFADDATPEAEKRAFFEAWATLQTSQPSILYFYSKYERTIYRRLQEKYPRVCTRDEIEALFDPARAVDLYYDVVLKATEWPTRDFSIKTLAQYLGFSWRDPHPSGAESIEWFHRWLKTGDPSVRRRILEYNEDDCRATRVLLDGIRRLAVG